MKKEFFTSYFILYPSCFFSRLLFFFILLAIFIPACRNPTVRIGLIERDLRSLAAKVADERGLYKKEGLAVRIEEFPGNIGRLEDAIRSGKLDAVYIDARTALAQTARGDVDLKILAIASRAGFAPDIVLAARGGWAKADAKSSRALIEAHKKATQMILEENPASIAVAAKWVGKNRDEFIRTLPALHFESGMDRAALIGLLDDLRRSKAITPLQAESMASRLIREEAESSIP